MLLSYHGRSNEYLYPTPVLSQFESFEQHRLPSGNPLFNDAGCVYIFRK
jgi:hypothetical protein